MRNTIICAVSILIFFGLYVGSFYYKDTRTQKERLTDEIIENINTHPNDWTKTTESQIRNDDRAAEIARLEKDTSEQGKRWAFFMKLNTANVSSLSSVCLPDLDDIYENKKCNIRLKISKPEPYYYTSYTSIYVYQDGKMLFNLYKYEADDLKDVVYAQLVKPEADSLNKRERIEQMKNDSITNTQLTKIKICK